MSTCLICQRLPKIKTDPLLIKEFKHTYFVLGDHQYFNGYGVVLLKNHVRDMHELSAQLQSEVFLEVMQAGTAIHEAFNPWKINYSCYGNVVEHIHWHIFPRYESDPDLRGHPWLNSEKFKDAKASPDVIQQNIAKIRAKL